MRINVYAEELTDETKFISKEVDGKRFYGIRLYLKSPTALHHTNTDDDRSAITFWVPWTQKTNNKHEILPEIFKKLELSCEEAKKHDKYNM
jgi:hypothetical protein